MFARWGRMGLMQSTHHLNAPYSLRYGPTLNYLSTSLVRNLNVTALTAVAIAVTLKFCLADSTPRAHHIVSTRFLFYLIACVSVHVCISMLPLFIMLMYSVAYYKPRLAYMHLSLTLVLALIL